MRTSAWRSVFRSGATIALCALFALPFVFMVLGSLRQPATVPPDGFDWWAAPLQWSNYEVVGSFVPVWRQMANSLVVAAVAVPLTVLIASWAGFAIATSDGRARRWLIGVSLVALMIPASALWVPRFVMFRWAEVTDTWVPLVAPALFGTSPFYPLLFALAYSRIPRNLYEAAALEGLSPLAVWRSVAWPLGRPAAFAVGVLAFAAHWSNFIEPLLYLSSPNRFTLPLGLRALQTIEPANHPIMLAGAALATLPPVIAFLAAQRAFFVRTLEV